MTEISNDYLENDTEQLKVQSMGWAPYASITISTIAGTIIGGVPGGAAGFTSALIDEFLITHKHTTKHFFSMTAFHSSVTFGPWTTALSTVFSSYKLPIQVASYALSIAASYYTDDFIDFHNKLELPLNSLSTLNKVFDERKIFSMQEVSKIYNKFIESPMDALVYIKEDWLEVYNNPFLSNFGTSSALSLYKTVIESLYLYCMGSYGSNLFISTLLKQNYLYKESPLILPAMSWGFDAVSVLSIHALKLYADMMIATRQSSISNEYDKILIEKASNMLLDKGNSRKVLSINEKEGKQSIEYIANDLFILVDGANKLIKVTTASLEAMIALNNLVKYAPGILLPYMALSLIPRQKILKDLIPQSQEIAEESADSLMQARSFFGDIKKRSEEIDLRDGGKFIKHKFNLEWKRFKEANLKTTAVETSKTHMYNAIDIHDKAIDILYFGVRFYLGTLDLDKIPLIYNASDTASDFLSSNLESQTDNIEIELARTRITKFIDWSKTVSQNANKTHNEEGNIVFNDYRLYLNEKLLVHIDYLELEQGKHYAFTGQKGCGKSTTLTDLKEGVVGAFSSTGEIEYPFNQNITFLNQKLYMPDSSTSTLLETLYFPKILAELSPDEQLEIRILAVNFLKALGLEKFIVYLDSKEYKCSGGELKTFGFIQAIIAKPNILILDESLNELDSLSVFKTLEAMNDSSNETTVILVTHNALNQNFKQFFHKEIHFENATVIKRDIAETPLTLEIEHYINSKTQAELTFCEEGIYSPLYGVCLADE